MIVPDKSIGLYIHIPFCRSKCYYCDFNSFEGMDDYVKPYFEALKCEMELYREKLKEYTVSTIYIGGGTPSFVDTHYIYEAINLCHSIYTVQKGAEISIETNPGTLSFDKLFSYRAVGINRLSMGLQAWQNRLLKSLGRIHSVEEFTENFNLARRAGFKNINLDLIFGLPDQSINDWQTTLDNVIRHNPEHISCYSLKIEEGTVFGERYESGKLIPADEEMDREMYYHAVDKLERHGYRQYEISNFARSGFECKHNLIYWNIGKYVGVGAGAHSYFGDTRFNNPYSLTGYIDSLSKGSIPAENVQMIDRNESIKEFIILGLRLVDGINACEFQRRFGEDMQKLFDKQFKSLLSRELIEIDGDYIKLSPSGMDLANQVFMEFI